jgi:hypothetical protein
MQDMLAELWRYVVDNLYSLWLIISLVFWVLGWSYFLYAAEEAHDSAVSAHEEQYSEDVLHAMRIEDPHEREERITELKEHFELSRSMLLTQRESRTAFILIFLFVGLAIGIALAYRWFS